MNDNIALIEIIATGRIIVLLDRYERKHIKD
jgi:hypothetical protein